VFAVPGAQPTQLQNRAVAGGGFGRRGVGQ
jgi:hypothetical protein